MGTLARVPCRGPPPAYGLPPPRVARQRVRRPRRARGVHCLLWGIRREGHAEDHGHRDPHRASVSHHGRVAEAHHGSEQGRGVRGAVAGWARGSATCPAMGRLPTPLGRDTWAANRCWRAPAARQALRHSRGRAHGADGSAWHGMCMTLGWTGVEGHVEAHSQRAPRWSRWAATLSLAVALGSCRPPAMSPPSIPRPPYHRRVCR